MGKYRHKDEAENSTCSDCDTPIWARQGIYTCYHGQGHHWNSVEKKEPCSYTVLVGSETGVVCPKCWKKYEKES